MEETIHSASEMLKQVVGYIQQDSRQKKKYRLRSSIKSLDDILHNPKIRKQSQWQSQLQ